MSRIYFHSQYGEAAVGGPERFHAALLCNSMMLGVLSGEVDTWSESPRIKSIMPPDSYMQRLDNRRFADSFKAWSSVDGYFFVAGKRITTFDIALNTALAMGSDPIKLMARLHGQCEIHAYVEGEHRNWLAGIIEQGRKASIMRTGMGWESVIELLRSRDDCPVVTSYSVCEQFPNADIADFEFPEGEDGEPDWDAWYRLPGDEQWTMALTGLRSGKRYVGLQMTPENWAEYYMDAGATAFTIIEYLNNLT